jgi:hypothetical protein
MPTKIIKPLKETTYKIIPAIPSYLISNLGRVYKKSTWKQIAVIDNIVRVTINKKQTGLSVSKLMRELFPMTIPMANDTVTAIDVTSSNTIKRTMKSNLPLVTLPTLMKNSFGREKTFERPIEDINKSIVTDKSDWRNKLIINPIARKYKAEVISDSDIKRLELINNYRYERGESKLESLVLATVYELESFK